MESEALSDITSYQVPDILTRLKWVGMDGLAISMKYPDSDGQFNRVDCAVNLLVSLDSIESKGIHMSRLVILLNQYSNKAIHLTTFERILSDMIDSQKGLSRRAKVEVAFNLLLRKRSLVSDEFGYQCFPVKIIAEKCHLKNTFQIELTIPYSSTCPCSASLSREAYQSSVANAFPSPVIDREELLSWMRRDAGSIATPHSQRSYLYIRMTIKDGEWPCLSSLIFKFEHILKTPVQTAVKREDEQMFARLNAENLMFCEDIARRIKLSLKEMPFVHSYWFKVEHQESLHPHNAVAIHFSE